MIENYLTFPIRTGRLTLRPFEVTDFEAQWSVYRDPNVVRYPYTDAWTERDAVDAFAKKSAARSWSRGE